MTLRNLLSRAPASVFAAFFFALSGQPPAWGQAGILQIRNGYFWDPVAQEYFVPRGIAYQIWNPPVGANQSFEQVDYDLLEFKKLYANSVRVEFVWGEAEIGDGVYDWSKPDHLVAAAEKLGLKLFVLIGFQYPPSWFPKAWRGINFEGLTPDVINCLATSTPAKALNCLPASTADCLSTNVPSNVLSNALSCLVTGAKAGGLSNIISRLETSLSADDLPKVLKCLISDVINYEHPDARLAYEKHIAAVTGRYRNSSAIGGWILGNEYAYFDLWEDPKVYEVHRFIGFDQFSQANFKKYLSTLYGGNILALNANWGTSYTSFEAVVMPARYPLDRNHPGYFDLIQWRKKSIGDFVALGAVAARDADSNHLKTYSMVGGIFNGRDANFTCEDAKAIVARCTAAGAPLDFWSLNNYANAEIGSEKRSADFGIGKYQEESGLPIMISETGHSSTEDLFDFPNAGARQAKALPGQVWESLLSGAIGTHLFHWSDRSQFTQGYFLRERGFGIVEQNRKIKSPVFGNVVEMFRRMQNVRLDNLLGGSTDPRPDVQFFWSTNADMVWPRANQENAMMWGALKRLGYQPGIIDDKAFENGAYTNAPALLLSRCFQMNPRHLDLVLSNAIPAGIHVHADADLPGQFDAYHRANPNWPARMNSIFGLGVGSAVPGLDAIVTNDFYGAIRFSGVSSLGPTLIPSYSKQVGTWKIWHGITVTSGKTIVNHSGYLEARPGTPALVIKTNTPGRSKSAINTFGLGDTFLDPSVPHQSLWDFRYDWLQAIYRIHFGMTPAIDLTGPGAKYVLPDYRHCRDGSILLSLLNEYTNSATVTLSAPSLLAGKKVENLTSGGVLATNSNGTLTLNLTGDDYVLLYAYSTSGGRDGSLINTDPNKIWFVSAPTTVWPRDAAYDLSIGYDAPGTGAKLFVSFEQAHAPNKSFAQVMNQALATGPGPGTNVVQVRIPDADLNDATYVSSRDGGEYVFHAWLERGGIKVSESFLPVRFLWGVHPVSPLPAPVVAGRTYPVTLEWQELPSYQPGDFTPLDRVILWDSLQTGAQHYNVILELRSADRIVATNAFLTAAGTGRHTFSIAAPSNVSGPFTWTASLQTATNVQSHDVLDSFEGRDRGARWPSDLARTFFAPWISFQFAFPNKANLDLWQNEGVQLDGSEGSQSAFLVITNPPNQTVSGFGLSYYYSKEWALPADRRQWTNYVFSFDFKESHSLPCLLEMQIKNVDPNGTGKWIRFSKPYVPGSNRWDTIKATLDQFGPQPDSAGIFEPDKVYALVLNVLMVTSNVQYVGSFDNIRFDGPDTALPGGEIVSTYTSANDSLRISGISRPQSGDVLISWPESATLQSAEELTGPWIDVPQAASPYVIKPSSSRRFYRLRR